MLFEMYHSIMVTLLVPCSCHVWGFSPISGYKCCDQSVYDTLGRSDFPLNYILLLKQLPVSFICSSITIITLYYADRFHVLAALCLKCKAWHRTYHVKLKENVFSFTL